MRNRSPTRPTVPAFTPVPRKHVRHDGWTAERQKAFLEALAETGSVKHASARINMSSESAYGLRRAPGSESFARAWAAALDHGVQRLTDLAIDRAIDGVEVPVYSYGKLVGTRRVYNDRLLMFCLRHGIGRNEGVGGASGPTLAPGSALLRGSAKAASQSDEQSGLDPQQEAELDRLERDRPELLARVRVLIADETEHLRYLTEMHYLLIRSYADAVAKREWEALPNWQKSLDVIENALDSGRPPSAIGPEVKAELGETWHYNALPKAVVLK